jgi:molybdopterin/thiamine biosynthesis adenylyltransferase
MPNKKLEITVSIPSLKDKTVTMSETSTVAKLKRTICKEFKIEPAFTNLLLDGRRLDDAQKLGDLSYSEKIIIDYMWARHLILWGTEGQSKIRNSTVFIAGAGAIGNDVAKNLAMLGIKRLVIVDYDVVELSNVSRMFLFGETDIGEPKAKVLARKIAEKYSFVETLAYIGSVEDVPLKIWLESDVIVCGLDNVASRVYLSSMARKYTIPMVDGGINGYQARVQVYIPPDYPCPLCHFPASKFSDLIGLKNPCDGQTGEEIKVPSLPTSTSFVSSIITQEALKIILGHNDFMGQEQWSSSAGPSLQGICIADLKFNKYSIIDLKRSPNCIVCGENGIAKEIAYRIEIPISKTEDSTSELIELAKNKAGTDSDNASVFSTDSQSSKIEKGKKLTEYNLKRGDFVTIVFLIDGGQTKQIVVKLT